MVEVLAQAADGELLTGLIRCHETFAEAIAYTRPGAETIRFTLDHDGQLLQESVISDAGDPTLGVRPGTAIQTTSYQPTTIIDTPPPGG